LIVPPWLLVAPLAVQGAAMAVDELYFHRRRGLGRWERLGHPVDTLTMVACVGWTLAAPPTLANVARYVAIAAGSCLFVTKDEFVHARRCGPGEHWLHALLFVVHPVALASMGALWAAPTAAVAPQAFGLSRAGALRLELAVVASFFVYQLVYWNCPRPRWFARTQVGP
jgi:hypothetical protein